MLQHISSGTVFEDAHDIFLAPLNEYVADAGQRFGEWFLACRLCYPNNIYRITADTVSSYSN